MNIDSYAVSSTVARTSKRTAPRPESSSAARAELVARSKSVTAKRFRSRGRGAATLFALSSLVLDLLLWLGLYFGISTLTGSYNAITVGSVIIPIGILMFSIALIGGYKIHTDFACLRYSSEHLIACMVAYPLAAFFQYAVASFGSEVGSSRAIFSVSILLFAIISLIGRRVFWFKNCRYRSRGKILAIVDELYGPQFYAEYVRSGQHQILRCFAAGSSMLGKPIAGEGSPIVRYPLSKMLSLLNRSYTANYEGIVIASRFSKIDPAIMMQLGVIHFEETPVYSMDSFYETFWSRLSLEIVGSGWPFEANFVLVKNSIYSALKRIVDVVVSLIALILLSPVMLLVALLIWIKDGSPIIYSQKRVGINQKPFSMYKFRSMKLGSDQGDSYTREGDARVTPLGVFLRKVRLDELPQLWNVLKGDMSLIGPRAEWTKLVEEYEAQIPNYHFRHLVRPGITGWAQVNYPYGASLDDTLQKLSYDLFYIRNFSLRLDAEVLLKTLHVMTFGKGR
ncbi:MAG: exopolysaccharide biosynthesis polyprenyl glycosylphosphotransferase [bacterium]